MDIATASTSEPACSTGAPPTSSSSTANTRETLQTSSDSAVNETEHQDSLLEVSGRDSAEGANTKLTENSSPLQTVCNSSSVGNASIPTVVNNNLLCGQGNEIETKTSLSQTTSHTAATGASTLAGVCEAGKSHKPERGESSDQIVPST